MCANPRAEEKIARVSGADLDLFEHSLTLEIRGTEDERNRAKKYVECVMAQRVGPVHVEEDDGEDLTTIMVPSEAVGFVTGSQAPLHTFNSGLGPSALHAVVPLAACSPTLRPTSRTLQLHTTHHMHRTKTPTLPPLPKLGLDAFAFACGVAGQLPAPGRGGVGHAHVLRRLPQQGPRAVGNASLYTLVVSPRQDDAQGDETCPPRSRPSCPAASALFWRRVARATLHCMYLTLHVPPLARYMYVYLDSHRLSPPRVLSGPRASLAATSWKLPATSWELPDTACPAPQAHGAAVLIY